MAQAVEGDFLLQFLDEFRAFRARSDEAHFPFEHVPQLGQFVDAGLADDFPHLGDARVGFHGPDSTVFLGVGTHGAEFVDGEILPEQAHATLPVNDGAGRFHTDGNGGEKHDGRCADQQAERGEQVESPFEAAQGTSGIERKAFFREQPFGADL